MTQFLNDNAALIALAAGGMFLWFRYFRKPVAPRNSTAPAPAEPQIVYRDAPAQEKDLLDMHDEYQAKRDREIRREGIKRRLDQAALDRWTLERVAEAWTPPAVPPPPAPKS